MSSVDTSIISFLNQFSGRWEFFDYLVTMVAFNHLFKGVILMCVLWWGFFSATKSRDDNRAIILSTVLACYVAMPLARVLANLLPFRNRPIHESELDFVVPHGMRSNFLDSWSSFPSDHAVLFFAIATGIALFSRRMGLVCFSYVTLLIALPRVYLGLHYPSDILAGAGLGIAIVLLFWNTFKNSDWLTSLVQFSENRPMWFFPGFFLLTYQIADMLEQSRWLAAWAISGFTAIF